MIIISYTNLTSEWRRITDRPKSGSGLAPAKEPKSFAHLNETFTETNEELDLCAESGYLSYTQDMQNIDNEKDSEDSDLSDADFPNE